MNRKIGKLPVVALMVGPAAAIAQTTAFYYQGDVMTGTSNYLPDWLRSLKRQYYSADGARYRSVHCVASGRRFH